MTAKFSDIESICVLYRISTIIQSDADLEDKCQRALAMVRDAAGCHAASLFIYNEKKKRLEEVATVGKRVDLIEEVHFDMGKGFSAWVAKNRESILIPNLRKKHHDGFRSFISTPLITGETLIGVMNLGHEKPNAFTDKHKEFLEIIAAQFAHTLERAQYQETLIEKNEALMKAQEEIKAQGHRIVEMEKYRVLGQIAVSINHEINNPLTTIIGNVELLLMAYPEMDETMKKKLNTINKEAQRIADIVEKLRNTKKIVLEDYLDQDGEKMIDIETSSNVDDLDK